MGAVQAKKLLAAPILVLALLGGFLAGHYTNNTSQLTNAMRVELYVYRNGQLIYYDPDDPATDNLLGLIAELIAGDVMNNNNNPATSVDGSKLESIYKSNYPGYVFVSFDSSYSYSATMSSLPTSYNAGQISSGGVTIDTTGKTLTLSASINVNQTGAIYGVGLYTKLYVYTTSSTSKTTSFILFYDPLDNPINVTSNDVVTVVYKIVVP